MTCCGLDFLGVACIGASWTPAPTAAAARAGLATIKRGHKGESVVYVQQRVGLDKQADGMFGPGTEEAVKKFQARNEIPETGVVDKLTMEALDAVNIVRETAPATPRASQAALGTPERGITVSKDLLGPREYVALGLTLLAVTGFGYAVTRD